MPLSIDPDDAMVLTPWAAGSENERSVLRNRELRPGGPSCRDAGLDGYGSSGESKGIRVEGCSEQGVFTNLRNRELRPGGPSCRDAGLDEYGSSGESKGIRVEGCSEQGVFTKVDDVAASAVARARTSVDERFDFTGLEIENADFRVVERRDIDWV